MAELEIIKRSPAWEKTYRDLEEIKQMLKEAKK
jgi:hypothetical protein